MRLTQNWVIDVYSTDKLLGNKLTTTTFQVRSESRCPGRKTFLMISSRDSLLPCNLTADNVGAQRSNSFIQLLKVLFGTMIKCGPVTFLYSNIYTKIEIDCKVLPRPISSAKILVVLKGQTKEESSKYIVDQELRPVAHSTVIETKLTH